MRNDGFGKMNSLGTYFGRSLRFWGRICCVLLVGSLGVSAAPLRNGTLAISDSQDPGFGWNAVGSFNVDNGAGVLAEDGVHLPSTVSQTFDLPAGAVLIHITLDAIDLQDNAALEAPDAFQISLLDNASQSLVGVTPQGETVAMFSRQRDGTLHYGAETQVPGAGASGAMWTPSFPVTVSIDVSGLTSDVAATLSFDLIGLGTPASSVTIGGVAIEGLEPTANDDTDATDEETMVAISVLANDMPATGQTLDPASIIIASGPSHGSTMIDTQNGRIEYTPVLDYTGPDNLTYTVADTDGNRSDPATVSLTVNPVNDAPTLQAPASVAAAKQTLTAITGISVDDVDARSGNLTFTLSVTRGRLSLADDVANGLIANQITGNHTSILSVTAPLPAINATLAEVNGLTYTGLLNLIGGDSLELSVQDNSNTGSGGPKAASTSIVINVSGSPKDAWRNAHFSVATLTDPSKEFTHWGDTVDLDGDQQDNQYEFVVDTDPNSVASKFDLRLTSRNGALDLIFSPIRPGRAYTVQFFDQLGESPTTLSDASISDQGEVRTVTDPAGPVQRFYRIQILILP